jgi:hypothetical protein
MRFLFADLCVFQVHYSSHTGPASDAESPTTVPTVLDFSQPAGSGSSRLDDSSASVTSPPAGAPSTASGAVKKNNIKKANLYAWISLPPLPEVPLYLSCLKNDFIAVDNIRAIMYAVCIE